MSRGTSVKYFVRFMIALLAIFANRIAYADVQITVQTGPTPTCVGRLHAQIIGPGGYGTATDKTAATRFVQTNEGTLGLTLFFEVKPTSSIDMNTDQALLSIGFVAVNRTLVTNVVPAQYKTFRSITKNMSGVWSNAATTPVDGTGNLAATLDGRAKDYSQPSPKII